MIVMQTEKIMPPLLISGVLWNASVAQILRSAVELDVFDALKDQGQTAETVASKSNINARGAEVLLDALVGLQLLKKIDRKYELSDTAAIYLVSDSPLFMGKYIMLSQHLNKHYEKLTEALKTGKSVAEVNVQSEAEEFFPELAAAIFPMSYSTGLMVARELKTDKLPAGGRILDVATGSGAWSIPIAQSNPSLKVDALDFPAVLKVTRDFVHRFEVSSQYNYLPGDWRDVALDDNAYDLVMLGHILHSEGLEASRQLLAKSRAALKPGGRLVIAEMMPNEQRTGPAQPLMFAITMYLMTSEGCVFSAEELVDLCLQTGFSKAYKLDLAAFGEESPILIANN